MAELAEQAGSVEARLTDALLATGKLDPVNAERAQRSSLRSNERYDRILVRLGLVSERDVAATFAKVLGHPLVEPESYPQAPLFEERISPAFLKAHGVLPLNADGKVLRLAMVDPLDDYAMRAIALNTGLRVVPCVAVPAELEQHLERLCGAGRTAITEIAGAAAGDEDSLDGDVEKLRDLASEAPVIRLVNLLIARAVEARASDIHIEPFENRLRVRFRIDGVLREEEAPPARFRAAIISRVKIMANLDIAERRLPQDGRIKLAVRGREIDLRVSTTPVMHGESVVLRILDRSGVTLDFAALGFDGEGLAQLTGLLRRPNGILLVTGPTGSGKTTTLYAALQLLNEIERKILTVEDPVEYQMEGVNQIQVKRQIGLTFASVLRAILRQDPDVIMIGEIRDLETAQIAVQAALTGHLVISTLHTNSAASTMTRLLDMGVERFLVASTVIGVVAQRLVRRLCPACRVAYPAVEALGDSATVRSGVHTLYRPGGCARCNGTGYHGRSVVFELLPMAPGVRRAVLDGADEDTLHGQAAAEGMRSLYSDALVKAAAGVTSLDEVLRVTREA
ncbi:type II secretion system ATPase GspE [Pelagibius sp. 7325]|uniref:type II secretion system ATPase GspE n=1 Tax=Pelagibius sp. 7325 TaxID=3131994 RepID=UPI0030ED4E98